MTINIQQSDFWAYQAPGTTFRWKFENVGFGRDVYVFSARPAEAVNNISVSLDAPIVAVSHDSGDGQDSYILVRVDYAPGTPIQRLTRADLVRIRLSWALIEER